MINNINSSQFIVSCLSPSLSLALINAHESIVHRRYMVSPHLHLLTKQFLKAHGLISNNLTLTELGSKVRQLLIDKTSQEDNNDQSSSVHLFNNPSAQYLNSGDGLPPANQNWSEYQ